MQDLSRVSVIIPALNEAASLRILLPLLDRFGLGQIIVCDNGSTDDTRAVIGEYVGQDVGENVGEQSIQWILEPSRGYGAACFAGMQHLAPDTDIVVFLDADLSDDPTLLPTLVEPIRSGSFDFVLSARVKELREPGAMTLPQRLANTLFPWIMRIGWGHRYIDMGPFRAIRRDSLDAIGMNDRAYGWTIEMQIRAVELNLRIREIPVPYARRAKGPSKISGTIRGVVLAAYWITKTCGALWITKRRRCK